MNKDEIISNLLIRDLKVDDLDNILNLIKSIYGEDYSEKEFYNRKVLLNLIRFVFVKNKAAWKGAFYNDKLIGQMLALIENKTVILKLTMVKKKFQNKGVIKKLCKEMIKEISKHSEMEFKGIYAFIESNNSYIMRILDKFNFKQIGRTPNHNSANNYYLIYCLLVFDLKERVIEPSRKLIKEVEKIISNNNLPRIISNHFDEILIPNELGKNGITFVRNGDIFPQKYRICCGNELMATYLENLFNNTWYNFQFKSTTSLKVRSNIIKKTLGSFKKNEDIYSITCLIEVDDRGTQELLIHYGFKFYGFLPFFYENKDFILFGTSKF